MSKMLSAERFGVYIKWKRRLLHQLLNRILMTDENLWADAFGGFFPLIDGSSRPVEIYLYTQFMNGRADVYVWQVCRAEPHSKRMSS